MEDAFIGGWALSTPGQPSTHTAQQDSSENAGTQFDVRATSRPLGARGLQTGYPFVRQPPLSHLDVFEGVRPSDSQNPLSQLSAVERSYALNVRKRMMNPYLQLMCGPLLRYDTVDEQGVWHGAALIVSECCCILPPIWTSSSWWY
jgi:hypothetical protein